MTAPAKPWENTPGINQRIPDIPLSPSLLPTTIPGRPVMGSSSITNLSNPPPLPPRPQSSGIGMTSSLGMPYGSSGFGSYGFGGGYGGGFGGYGGGYGGMSGGYGGMGGGYGMYGSPYGLNRYGAGGMYGADAESRFIQIAEESTRPTFQSIESIVGAVGSVAMMLENTFMAMTSSFRAILGVAENFGRLRSLFAQFWSAFAVFRGINWLLKKLLVLMGIRTEEEFKAWAQATVSQRETQGGNPEGPKKPSSWPALVFLGVIMAAPYIIMKMLGSLTSSIQANLMDPSTWKNPMKALTQFDFQASSAREISFIGNQIITIAPEELQGSLWNSGWLMATVDNKNVGLIPTNYVKVFRNNQLPNPPVNPNYAITDKASIQNMPPPQNNICGVHTTKPHETDSIPTVEPSPIPIVKSDPVPLVQPNSVPSTSGVSSHPNIDYNECYESMKKSLETV